MRSKPRRNEALKYHAVMIDETGCEFPAEVEADNEMQAREMLRERYPESRADEVLSEKEHAAREDARYDRLADEIWGEEEVY